METSGGRVFGLAVLCAGAGCATHMTVVRPLPPDKEAEINGLVESREAKLTFDDKRELDSKDVRVTGGSIRFLERDPATSPREPSWLPETEKPLASVRQIQVRDSALGGFQGLGIGAAIGIVLGAIGGAAAASPGEGPNAPSGSSYALVGAVLGGLGVGLLGATIGAGRGAPRTIEFKDAPSH